MFPAIRRARSPIPSLLGCGLVAALTAFPAIADESDELTRLRERAAQLRQELGEVEARIGALENRDAAEPKENGRAVPPRRPDPPAAALLPLASLKQNWSRVRPGAPQDEVRELLGEPQKMLRIDGAPVWLYAYPGIGRGSVFFDADGKVSSAQSPSFGW
ncbi:MAG TPA: hypothetical protein VEF92_05250 [Burkholderiales bacterium]|nr:hypothetical protein [Burkholderiales bacterium]